MSNTSSFHLHDAITISNAAKFNSDFPAKGKRITPGISGAHGSVKMKDKLIARPLHAVVMPRLEDYNSAEWDSQVIVSG